MFPVGVRDPAALRGVAGREGARYSSVGQSIEGERSPEGVDAQCPALLSQDVSASCP